MTGVRSGPGGVLLDGIAEAGLLALLLLAPIPFGAVEPGAIFGIVAWSAVLVLLVVPRRAAQRIPHGHGAGLAALSAFFAVALFHVVPLPAAVVGAVSPAAFHLRATIPGAVMPAYLPLSVHAGASLEYITRLTAYLGVFTVAAGLSSAGRSGRRILAAVFAAGVFQAVYGSAEYLTGHQHIFGYAKRYYTDSATGTYINKNHYAGALEMALLVGAGFVMMRLRREHSPGPLNWRRRLAALFEGEQARTFALALTVAAVGVGLVLSYSRAGIAFGALACFFSLGASAKAHGDRRRARFAWILAGLVLVLLSVVGWSRVIPDIQRHMGGIGLENGRARVWLDSLRIVADYPLLGSGPGTFVDIYPLYRAESIREIYDYAHNDYVQALVETGLIGAAALAAVLLWFVLTVIRGLGRHRGPDLPLLMGAAGGALAMLLHETIDFNLQIPANAVLFAALAGALVGALSAPPGADRGVVVPFVPAAHRPGSAA